MGAAKLVTVAVANYERAEANLIPTVKLNDNGTSIMLNTELLECQTSGRKQQR